jgi:hypothetical protein
MARDAQRLRQGLARVGKKLERCDQGHQVERLGSEREHPPVPLQVDEAIQTRRLVQHRPGQVQPDQLQPQRAKPTGEMARPTTHFQNGARLLEPA